MSEEEWGPWIEHDGKGCPCVGMWLQIVHETVPGCFTEPKLVVARGGRSWRWDYWLTRNDSGKLLTRVVRYRIRKPRGLTILESLLTDLPGKVDA